MDLGQEIQVEMEKRGVGKQSKGNFGIEGLTGSRIGPALNTLEGHSSPLEFTLKWRVGVRRLVHFFFENKPTKLLKTQGRCPESDKTIPISDTFTRWEIPGRDLALKGDRISYTFVGTKPSSC